MAVLGTIEEAVNLGDEVAQRQSTALTDALPAPPVVKQEVEEGSRMKQESTDDEPPAKKAKSTSLLCIFLDDEDEDEEDAHTLSKKDQVQNEVDRYIAEPKPKGKDLDVLLWWQEHKAVYPFLARVARKLLCVPASSTSSERVFSVCGSLVSKKRANLSPDMIDMMVFLNKNSKCDLL